MDSDDEVPTLLDGASHDQDDETSLASFRVPLTLITGFLGAGKSTLLKRIVTERHGLRIAVIMNEFGDTADIEAKAINISSLDDPTAEQSQEYLELANGCLCCSIKDTGVAAIEMLMRKKGAFDHIILETTGLADPGPIASIFWQNEELGSGLGQDISLDGVVCVVDAVFGQQQIEEDQSFEQPGESIRWVLDINQTRWCLQGRRQIACADVILLNKVDLAPNEKVSIIEGMIRLVNPIARIFKTVRGEVDLDQIISISAYASIPRIQNPFPPTTHTHSLTDDCDQPDCSHEHSLATHYELRGFSSLQISCPVLSSAQLAAIDEWIRVVLWDNRFPGSNGDEVLEILRCKGVFVTESGDQYVLQGVRSLYELSKVDSRDVMGVPEKGKLVLIGKGLNENVRRSFQDKLATSSS